ncbi:MAG: hypothetical protein DRJ66_05755 [Thermoprotei archaeon]|nr:MAG: hypothetical protein DRJ66_05755 [Thermoprotei archaeon]
MDLRGRLLNLAKELARLPKDSEYSLVIFEDGYATPIITQGRFAETVVPIKDLEHGHAIAILHTHPLPRIAPSLADLRSLLIMSTYNVPSYLGTVYRKDDKIIVTLYIAKRKISLGEVEHILRSAYVYELLHAYRGFREDISEKQLHEQHLLLRNIGIVVERYIINAS